ncbi:raftlin isoform X3 [Homo sapiens]|uniref:raftlin isoform X3 n=1 Tax=Homo sapiens TaxID=9606 RepID=UPI0005D00A81|nr:raftlin isoform X3 [Homo sapiens]XP_054201803.1 raftlin isoform X3 [Homo sapiens]|eukprot:XP_011531833.1 raftlin isoform X4 [Homo sapiens]
MFWLSSHQCLLVQSSHHTPVRSSCTPLGSSSLTSLMLCQLLGKWEGREKKNGECKEPYSGGAWSLLTKAAARPPHMKMLSRIMSELPGSSAVRLASLRDLPAQLLELYQQGFSLAALHPFVQPTHEREKTPLEHIFRAILIKKTDRSQKTDLHNEGYILELDCCSSLDHPTDQKLIPEFIKKIQEAASQGLKFVGVIPQYHSSVNSAGSSAPVSTANSTEDARDAKNARGDHASLENEKPGTGDVCSAPAGRNQSPEPSSGPRGEVPLAKQPSSPSGEGDGGELSPQGVSKTLDGPESNPLEVHEEPLSGKMEIFTLFNKPKSHQKCRQYYPVTIPLHVSKNGQTVSGLDANWLEHMSDHFRKGGMLVNAVFYLGIVNGCRSADRLRAPAELAGGLWLAAHLCATNSRRQDYQRGECIHQADCLSSETLSTSENQEEGIEVSVAILQRRNAQQADEEIKR